jgi:acetyltransferase-like isoleucine patch superfamily enzyme
MLTMLAKIRNKICNFFVANCPTFFGRALFLKLGGAKIKGKIYLHKGNYFTDFKKIQIEGNCIIGRKNVFLSRGGIKIGKNCLFSGNSFLITQSHELESENFDTVVKPIEVGNNCWIGTNATILPGVKLGEGCVVGASAVVTKSFPPYSVIVGNPAKKVKERNKKSLIKIE